MNCRITILIAALSATLMIACTPARFSHRSDKLLVGTEWHLVQLRGEDVSFTSDKFNVVFSEDGSLTGIGACNRFTAPYSATKKQRIDIGTIASTRRFCPDIESEQAMFKELDGATSYKITDSTLQLYRGENVCAAFRAKE